MSSITASTSDFIDLTHPAPALILNCQSTSRHACTQNTLGMTSLSGIYLISAIQRRTRGEQP